MPTLNLKKNLLFKALGQTYSDDDFSDLCFSFGLELDEVVTEKDAQSGVDEIIYKIDIPANRYDLLCLEGLSTGLLIFQEKMELPFYKSIVNPDEKIHISVMPNTAKIRPYIVGAILKNVTLNKERYDSFIDFQDKLHHNICRKRTLVAIGTHDMDTIKFPLRYDALPPAEIKFRPLNQEKEFVATELMELYANHAQLKQYLPIIRDSEVYPVVLDAQGVVLSLPPVINGHHSRISVDTKNILIECTATDLHKAVIVLDTLVCAFSEYCETKYSVDSVLVVNNKHSHHYPTLSYRTEVLSAKKINDYLGIRESADNICRLLTRMCLRAETSASELKVQVPPSRHDVLHACDIIEDVAIAYGYNNIEKTLPTASSIAHQVPLNKLTEQLRNHLAFCGMSEALPFALCSRDDVSTKLRKNMADIPAVHIGNPKTLEFQVARTSLLPGLLKTIAANKRLPLPLKLFEVSDVVFKDEKSGVGARNERHVCVVNYNKLAGFEIVHGLLDKLMQLLGIISHADNGYSIRQRHDETYFPDRCAEILYKGSPIGMMGVIHPDVLKEFDLNLPCSSFEIDIEKFV